MKKLLSAAMAAALSLSLAVTASAGAAPAAFSDVQSGSWYYEEIGEMVAAGYIAGYEDGTFQPDREVSIAEFVTIVARCLGVETGEENGHWAGRQMGRA